MPTASEQIALMYPWLPPEVITAYDDAYRGGSVDPWADVRQDPRYEIWFPGNLTDEGAVRYGEGQYVAVRESYRDVMRSFNLNPEAFEDRFTELMKGEVSPDEFAARANEVYDRVVSASDQIQQAFAQANGLDITVEGILASALDPDLGDRILNREISMAEITGAGAESGFTLDRDRVAELEAYGLNLDQARSVYQNASSTLPVLDILAARHNDPDDDFDLYEFEQAQIFNDPQENLRMRRLISQERSLFGGNTSIRSDSGGLIGLLRD